ncbi:hypothetical protein RRG08_019952 [Elysia crispata]|uniref:Uncharacterized protein n=1 Tax=Elysia crispata TaxID=231223 RepID=A0AAE0Y7T4_9GAST|nr:hypothetical protein RRG08_019952 [Elysia crispata]
MSSNQKIDILVLARETPRIRCDANSAWSFQALPCLTEAINLRRGLGFSCERKLCNKFVIVEDFLCCDPAHSVGAETLTKLNGEQQLSTKMKSLSCAVPHLCG